MTVDPTQALLEFVLLVAGLCVLPLLLIGVLDWWGRGRWWR